jgi:hypothetical protein
MMRATIVCVLVLLASSCTLLLPTEEIIIECTVPEECGEGFLCEENACLPADTIDSSAQ